MPVLLILLALLLLLLITPVGAHVSYRQELLVRMRFGFLRLTVYPPKKKDKPKKEKKPKAPAGKPERPKPTVEQIIYSVEKLWPALKGALGRTRRRIRIDPLKADVVFAGEDPADVAILYSKVQGLVSGLMPVIKELLTIKNSRITLATDYEAEKTDLTAEIGVRILVWDIFVIGFGLLGTAVSWLRGYQKLGRASAAAKAAQTTGTTGTTTTDAAGAA